MPTFYNAYNEEVNLTSEQEKCLNYHFSDRTLLIKGYAGAGKSFALQTMALKYISMYPEGKRNHKIAVFTYTNSLTTATKEFLEANPQLNGKDVETSTVNKYLMDVYKAMGGPYKKMYWGKIRQDNIKQALDQHSNKYGAHRFHDLPIKFWEEEIDWMKGMNVSTDNMDYYLSLPRKGRGSSVRMSAPDRVVAYQIYVEYCAVNDKKGAGDWDDFGLYINKRLREYAEAKAQGKNATYPIPAEYLYDLIFIDEAQDLTLSQMFALMGLFSKSMVIAMDAHQRIYAANWTTKQLGIDTQTQWLKKSMRNTIEIDALAESLRVRNDEILGADERERRAIPEKHGGKPIICQLKDSAEERTFVINQIKSWQEESTQMRIGIIAATNDQVDKYSTWCSDADIYHEIIQKDCEFSMKTPGVKIVNVYNAKGLEFYRVIIPEFVEGSFPFKIKKEDPEEQEILITQFRSLAYVAMTRAQETLVITCSGKKISRFIGEMDSTLYEKRGTVNRSYTYTSPKETNSSPKPSVQPIRKQTTSSSNNGTSLKAFFEGKGFECVDKRNATGGSLWVIGSRSSLAPIINEAKRIFGDLGNNNFAEHGGKATEHQPAWFMTSNK